MVSAAVFKSIDKYAKLYQHIVRIPVEWDTLKQKLVYVSTTKRLAIWYISTSIMIFGVVCFFNLSVSQFLIGKSEVELWIVIFHATMGLLASHTCSFALLLSFYGEDMVFACNSLTILSKRIAKSKQNI